MLPFPGCIPQPLQIHSSSYSSSSPSFSSLIWLARAIAASWRARAACLSRSCRRWRSSSHFWRVWEGCHSSHGRGGCFRFIDTDKIKEEGRPIHPKKGISSIEDEGPRWDGNKFPLPPRDTDFYAPLPSRRRGSCERARNLLDSGSQSLTIHGVRGIRRRVRA